LQTVARKRFALCYRTVVLSACLSGYDVGVLWPNGWMDQDETWHGGRSRSRPHCIRREPSSLIRGTAPKFSAHVFCVANGWMDQDTIWFEGRPSPRPHCVRWGPPSPTESGTAAITCWSMSVSAKRSHVSATAELWLNFTTANMTSISGSAIAEGPRDALTQLKSCQLLHNCTKNHI